MLENSPVHILLVEDNSIDVRATQRAARTLATPHTLAVVCDGAAAMAYVTARENPRPDLVLLDLNLPGTDGFDVLTAMKTDPELRRIPIVVVTTSADDADVRGAYDRGANAFVSKPANLSDWEEALQKIEAFWFSLARVPPQ